MKADFIAFDSLRISNYNVQYIKDLLIENDINNHATLKATCVLDDCDQDKYVQDTDEETSIVVYYEEEGAQVRIFNGLVTKVKMDVVNSVYTMYIEAKSYTYKLDIQKRKRDFQDVNMTTHQLIDEVMKAYPSAKYHINIPNEAIGQFFFQYNETDFEFLRRVVSKYHQGVLCAMEFENIHIYFGTPENPVKPKDEITSYTVSKDIEEYNDVKNNDAEEAIETDFVTYEINAFEVFKIADNLQFKGKKFYIKKITHEIVEGKLENTYYLRPKGGLRSNKIYNMNLIGISIKGSILEVQRDRVKVDIETENKTEKDTAYWFPYASVAASPDGGGWYCMPEVGEKIRLNCPTKDEKRAFVVNAIEGQGGEGGGRMSDPSTKSLLTDSGQEVKFSPSGVAIDSNGGQARVNFNQDGTINITGQKGINVACAKNLSLRAENEINISAQDTIDILCETGSNLIMTDEISVTGKKVHNNG